MTFANFFFLFLLHNITYFLLRKDSAPLIRDMLIYLLFVGLISPNLSNFYSIYYLGL